MRGTLLFLIFLVFSIPVIHSAGKDDKDKIRLYNHALSLYKENNYEESSEILQDMFFKKAELEVEKLLLQSANKYRIGEKASDDTAEITGAVQSVDESIGLLMRALEMDPDNEIASNNLEKAMLLKEKLQDRQNREQQSGQGQQSQQDQADGLQKEQEQLADDRNKQSEEHRESQEDLKNRTENLKDQTEQGSPERENLEKAVEAQKEAGMALENGDLQTAEEKQNEAASQLEEAVRQMSRDDSRNTPVPEQKRDQNENDNLIQSIIDYENNREEKNSDERGSGVAVERNW